MKLIKGLYRDTSFEEQPNSSWVGGANLVHSSKYNELINEPGHTKIINTLAGTVIGIIDMPSEFVIFQVLPVDSNKNSEVGISIDDEYTTLFKANLNLNTNFPVTGQAYRNFKGELIIFFTDGFNVPRIVNVDELPFNLSSNKEVVLDEDLELINLFSNYNVPSYSLLEVNDNNGSLLSGVYYVTLQYELPDGNFGNFMHLSNAINIIQASSNTDWVEITGCEPGETTSKSINIKVTNIDTKYKRFRFGLIHKANSTLSAYVSTPLNISKTVDNYIIGTLEDYSVTTVEDILIKSTYYNKIKHSTVLQNTLWVAGLEEIEEIRYQKYANNIKLEYVYEEDISLDGFKGSHKDPVILFDKKSFMPNEIYAFYIRFHYKGGNRISQAFHIPGRAPVGGDDNWIDSKGIHNSASSKVYQFDDTCNASGRMSRWANENERYPLEDNVDSKDREFNGTVDYDGIAIAGGVNLNGTHIRHHKFPSFRFLNANFTATSTIANTSAYSGFVSASPSFYNHTTDPLEVRVRFNVTTLPAVFVYDGNNNIIQNNETEAITFNLSLFAKISFIVNDGAVSGGGVGTAYVKVKKNGVNIYSIEDTGNYPSIDIYDILVTDTMAIGDLISIEMGCILLNGTSISRYITHNKTFYAITLLDYSYKQRIEGNIAGKIIGIQLKSVFVSQEVFDKCDYYEVLYAERTNENASVLAQGLFANKADFYGYDLISQHKLFNATHMFFDGYLTSKIYGKQNINADNSSLVSSNGIDIGEYTDAIKFAKITKNEYVARNNSLKGNIYREELIKLTANPDDIVIHPSGESPVPYGDHNHILLSVLAFKPDVYLNFSNQKLVRTGTLNNILATGYTQTSPIYGGDVHFNLQGVIRYKMGVDGNNDFTYLISYCLVPVYSILNIGYRYKGKELNETFYPAHNFVTNKQDLTYKLDEVYNQPDEKASAGTSLWLILKDAFGYEFIYDWEEYYSNILDYNSVLNVEPNILFDLNNDFTQRFPYRLHKSLIQKDETSVQNWRIFLPNEYHESATDKGEIINITNDGKDLLIQHEHTLFVARDIQQLEIGTGVVAALGSSDLFSTRPLEITYSKNGYIGCQSKFSMIRFKFGILIVDRQQGKIFIYNNLEVLDISALGLEEWFDNNLQYSRILINTYNYRFDDGDIILFDDDEGLEYAAPSISEMLEVDNPFTQFGIFAVWDDKNDRLLITKVYNDSGINECSTNSFTISYYPELKQWGFFHNYVPNYAFSNRNGLFLLRDSEIYRANNLLKRNWFLGSYIKSFIDVVFNLPLKVDKLYNSMAWSTEYFIDGKLDETKTFTAIRMLNYRRDSSLIELNSVAINQNTDVNIRRTGGEWKFNDVRDKLDKTPNVKLINKLDTNIIQSPSGISYTKDWFGYNRFTDTYMIVRLEFTNSAEKVEFRIFDVTANFNIITR